MTHGVGQKHGNAIIFFDSGRSYVVCDMPERQEKYKIHDKLGRTEEERKFLDSFEKIFCAAANGDLKKCQTIVEQERFGDIDAYSVGKFANQRNGKSLDYVSPRLVAQMNGHTHVAEYFAKHFGGGTQISKSTFDRDQLLNNAEKKKTYEFYKTTYEEAPFDILVNAIQVKILSTYTLSKQIEKAPLLKEMDIVKLFEALQLRSQEEFNLKTPYETENRIELYALQDVLAASIQFQKTQMGMADLPQSINTNSEAPNPTPGSVLFGADCSPEFTFLNNDYPASFEFGGRYYLSATSAYIAQQFLHRPDLMDKLTTLNAEQADDFCTEHYQVLDGHLEEWFAKRKETMAHVLRAKFGQNPSLKQQLLLTGNFYFSYHSLEKGLDPYWSDDADGSGQNGLGKLLMALRKEYGG